jgi:serine/threonine-protein kinase
LALVDAILAAYAHLHRQGVLHGDVHPNNVLVGLDGSVRLIDFGLAARQGEWSVPRGGVDFFMEPESALAQQAGSGASPLTAAGEQYSIAAMSYRFLTGAYTHAFSLEPDEMQRQLLTEPPLPFARHGVVGLSRVEAVLNRALAKDAPGRFKTIDALLVAYRAAAAEDLASDAAPGDRGGVEPGSRGAGAFLADVLERFRVDGPLLGSELVAPTASVNLGAAGIAAGILRVAMARDDERLLALADLWSMKALAALGSDEAFVNEELEITAKEFGTTGIHHSATGVYLTDALIAHARGDAMSRSVAVDGFLSIATDAGPERDISFGRSGILLGIAMLVDALPDSEPSRAVLVELGDRLAAGLWDELASMPELRGAEPDASHVRYLGAAHGWTGFLYAQLRWAEATVSAPPPIAARLAELEALAVPARRGLVWPREVGPPDDGSLASTWCNGAAGMVPLWTLAARLLGEDRYAQVAERAAWSSYEGHPAPGDLCCGLAGRAYALIHLYRMSGERIWLARARDLGEQAVAAVRENALRRDSLYKGEIGVAALLADLDRPDDAVMPMYDRDAWPRTAGVAGAT